MPVVYQQSGTSLKDQSQCLLKLSGMGGDMGMQPIVIGINHKAANLATIYYHIK